MHGKIDIKFSVKGGKGEGVMRFKSERRTRMGYVSFLRSLGYSLVCSMREFF
jgi:cytochrome c oxidase assembly factor 1